MNARIYRYINQAKNNRLLELHHMAFKALADGRDDDIQAYRQAWQAFEEQYGKAQYAPIWWWLT